MHRRWRDAPAPGTKGMFPEVRDEGARWLRPCARLLVVAPNWLGDAVMALPAAADAARGTGPTPHLAVAARPSVAALFAMVPGVQQVVTLESRAGLSGVRRWRRDVARLEAERFDLAVLFPNSFLSAWITAHAQIPARWGYATDLRGRWLTRAFRRPPADVHQADYYLALTTAAGLAAGAARGAARAAGRGRRGRAGARAATRLRGAGAGRRLRPRQAVAAGSLRGAGRHALAHARTDAGRHRRRRRSRGRRRTRGRARRAARRRARRPRRSSISSAAPTWRRSPPCSAGARAVVANDSGAMHLAGAVGTAVVAIFGPTNEQQTAPLIAVARRSAGAPGHPSRVVPAVYAAGVPARARLHARRDSGRCRRAHPMTSHAHPRRCAPPCSSIVTAPSTKTSATSRSWRTSRCIRGRSMRCGC